MEPNEIIANNEEVIETAVEEVATAAGSGSVLKYAATFGFGAVVGILAYEYVYKPLRARFQERKEDRLHNVTTVEATPVEVRREDDEEEASDDT